MSVDFEQRGPFAVATINRPEARNAVNGAVAQGIEEAIDKIADKGKLLPIIERVQADYSPAAIVPISALKGSGVEAVIKALTALALLAAYVEEVRIGFIPLTD